MTEHSRAEQVRIDKATAVIDGVLLDLEEHFGDLDDQEDAPFGEYARVTRGPSSLTVMHETEDWGIEIIVRPVA